MYLFFIIIIGGLFLSEVSNFPMHFRIILRSFGLRYTLIYELIEIIYLFLYLVARGVCTPILLTWKCIISENTPLMVKIICVGITV